ncbi:MAG: DNA polymerase I [bacterium]|nr:DNA polymerase I [bacterium]
MPKKLVLIDGNALVHRAFHALPPLKSPKGIITNAVFGFSSILIKMIKELQPEYIAATFDLAGPTFRHEEFEEYKSQRVKAPDELYAQLPLVKNVLSAFGIPMYEKPNYEADDVVGTMAEIAKKKKDVQVVIATGDLDTLQLVEGDKVVVFTLRKGVTDTVVYDEKAVMERYGLKPEQLNDYRGLKGDPSDNIPGVPGVGEKTASALIQTFQSLDGLYEAISNFQFPISKKDKEKIKSPLSEKLIQKLQDNKDQAYFSKQLSTIVTDLDIDFSIEKTEWRKNFNKKEIEKIFRDLGFTSLIKRLPELGEGFEEDVREQTLFSVKQEKTVYDSKTAYFMVGIEDEVLKEVASRPDWIIAGYDLKYLYKKAIKIGRELNNPVFDTKIAAYVLNSDQKNYEFEKIFYDQFNEMPGPDLKRNISRLKKAFEDKLKSYNLDKVFNDIEMPLIKVLADMESNGIKVDTDILAGLLKSSSKELAKLEKEIHKLADMEFNINSPSQLGDVIFNKLGLLGKVRKTTGGAKSTAAPELEKLRDEHPIIELIMQYRELQKLKTTYIEPFPALISEKDKRVHTTYNQAGAATGRLSSQDPNLQNIPVRTELGQEFRKAFVAEPDYLLTAFDYSQVELRVAAHLAKDKKMIEAFRAGEDIHTATAAEIFGVSKDKVDKEMRRQAKALNFGVLFGMGPIGFMRSSGVDRSTAREFIDRYFEKFSGVARYIEETKQKAHRDGYVETLFGRKRPMQDIYSTMPQVRAYAERMAVNMPIQGTEADIMKLAMIKVYEYLKENFKKEDVRMLLQVHDELVIEVKEDIVKKISPEIKRLMESVCELDAPLVVDVKSGHNWQEMKNIY